jgi:hypothetical protein
MLEIYHSQRIVLKVAFMLKKKIKIQTAVTLFLKLYFLTLNKCNLQVENKLGQTHST